MSDLMSTGGHESWDEELVVRFPGGVTWLCGMAPLLRPNRNSPLTPELVFTTSKTARILDICINIMVDSPGTTTTLFFRYSH